MSPGSPVRSGIRKLSRAVEIAGPGCTQSSEEALSVESLFTSATSPSSNSPPRIGLGPQFSQVAFVNGGI